MFINHSLPIVATCIVVTLAIYFCGAPIATCQDVSYNVIEVDGETAAAMARTRAEVVAAREARLAASHEAARGAVAFARPQMRINSGYTYTGELESIPFGTFGEIEAGRKHDYRASMQADQLIWSGGRKHAAKDRAFAAISEARSTAKSAGRDAALRARRAVTAVLYGRASLAVAQDRVRQRREELDDARDLQEVGNVTNLDVRQAEINLIQTEDSLSDVETGLEQAQFEIAAAVAADPNEIRVRGELQRPGAIDEIIEEAHGAIHRGPEVELLEARILAEQAEQRLQRALRKPELRTVANITTDGDEIGDLDDTWSMGLTLQWNLYQGGEREALMDAASLRAVEFNYLRHGEIRERQRQVNQLETRVTLLNQRILAQERAVKLAKSNYEDAREQYRAGLITITRLGEISLDVAEAQFRYLALVRDEIDTVDELRTLSE